MQSYENKLKKILLHSKMIVKINFHVFKQNIGCSLHLHYSSLILLMLAQTTTVCKDIEGGLTFGSEQITVLSTQLAGLSPRLHLIVIQ